jgi:hypothetical protein
MGRSCCTYEARKGAYRERNYLDDLSVDGRIILKLISPNFDGLIWLRIGTCGGLL